MRIELSDCATPFALELLDQFDSHISAKSLWGSISRGFPICYSPSRNPFSALHCVSYFGIAEVANTLMKMNRWDVNQRDSAGMTPLIWAARYGHEKVVRSLSREKHIRPDQKDTNYGRTALSWAAGNGHEGVVRFFLSPQFINPGIIGRRWGKALRAVGLPFDRRHVNPDSISTYGRTPLSLAAENGYEGVVELLLEREDVNPNTPDILYGQTPLLWAARNGHEGIVRLLLRRGDVDPNIPGAKHDRTPLWWAAENGHEGVVKLLLGREGINPNGSSGSGQTPLSLAARRGHEGIVKLLLEREDVNPNTPDAEYGRTPLSWASRNGHEGTVELLLGRGDVNPDTSNAGHGQTPLLGCPERP